MLALDRLIHRAVTLACNWQLICNARISSDSDRARALDMARKYHKKLMLELVTSKALLKGSQEILDGAPISPHVQQLAQAFDIDIMARAREDLEFHSEHVQAITYALKQLERMLESAMP